MLIRPATPEDYPALAAIMNLTRLDIQVTPEQLARAHQNRDPKIKFGQWVAEKDGQVVGLTSHTQHIDIYEPDKLWVMLRVHPDHQQQGIGSQLFEVLLEQVQVHQPQALLIAISEKETVPLGFATRRGFVEYGRRWESLLDVPSFDPAPYAHLEADLAAQGIVIRAFADLADDPDRDQKFYHLQMSADLDVPMPVPYTPPTFEQFRTLVLRSPEFLPDGTFIAVHGEQYVGLSSFFLARPDTVHVDLTGTLAAYRRRGIARALKVRGIQYAQAQGLRIIGVMNDPVNVGMLAINDQLGFVRQPAHLHLAKRLR